MSLVDAKAEYMTATHGEGTKSREAPDMAEEQAIGRNGLLACKSEQSEVSN